jgi:hypothetical protein
VSGDARPTVFISGVSHVVLFFGIHALENLLDNKEGLKALTETAINTGRGHLAVIKNAVGAGDLARCLCRWTG